MVASLVLTEKVRRPTAVGLRRARLEDPLLADDGPGLILVSAPAGSGKSTLLAKVAAATTLPVSWYRVSAEDADPGTLLSHLAYTLVARDDAHTAVGPVPSDVEGVLELAHATAQPSLLIVDDLHEIAGTAAEAVFETFASMRPQTLRMILASRRAPGFNLPLLRATGAIHDINSDDLRFRVWEVEELFTLVHREPLSPQTAAALTRRTGGWAAGLQLFHLANSRKTTSARQQAVSDLGPRARMVRAYLARNVLDELPDERRRFLVLTSALGLVSGPLCDALLETTGSARVLEELERDQLFTTTFDDGLTFRYHEVFLRHLQMTLLVEQGVERTRAWYARCAGLLEASAAYGDAIRAYAMAEDWASIARLVRRSSGASTAAVADEPGRLLPPALVRGDPWLALADARHRLRQGAIAEAVDCFHHAQTLLAEPRFRQICAAEGASARVWLPNADDVRDSTDAMTAWSARIRAAARARARRTGRSQRAPQHRDRDALADGVEALLAGDFAIARSRFADVVASTGDVSIVQLSALLGAVVADAARSVPSDYAARLEEITLDADARGYPWVSRLARGMLAAILAVSDDAPWRLDAFAELLADCDRAGDVWGAALLQLACAVASSLTGHAAAQNRYADAEQRLVDLDAGAVAAWAQRLATRYRGGATPAAIDRSAADVTPRVRLLCFGGFRIVVDGSPADLGELRPRALALLRILALDYGTSVHRERLIDVLWPGAALDIGTRRLQVGISSIRSALQHCGITDLDAVRRTGDSYRLVLSDAAVDVRQFDELLVAAKQERHVGSRVLLRTRALDLYTGDVFPEDGSAEHILAERERLRFAAADAAYLLARDHAAQPDLDAACTAARTSLRLDRYQDGAWELLADCLSATGDDAAATRARLEHSWMRESLEESGGFPDGTVRFASRQIVPPLSAR
jgi:DNA-binding SARP family transcriptional activator